MSSACRAKDSIRKIFDRFLGESQIFCYLLRETKADERKGYFFMPTKNLLVNVDLSSVKRDYAWYTVTTLFNCEESYIRNLKESIDGLGIAPYFKECYIPIQYVKKDGKVKKLKGDFSRYVFVKCILTAKVWNLLRTTSGAAVVLTTGGVPVEVSDREIDSIRAETAPVGLDPQEEQELRERLIQEYRYKGFKKPVVTDEDFNTDFTA